ncbi:MAG TPA: 2-amino-4-hydroxy-6-hydroxymethyldihydropteridine diphosphokinase, partial [Pelomicrobium sp.]|nr:2-amino-4-hydroxy-6-hydroxymethyldihydropteridine diphosphokinase [Pelomicrobium sp.]
AIGEIDAADDIRVTARSALYRTAPVGYLDQPDFINAVIAVETALPPRALLDALLAIERAHGRQREFPNAPRTLDLDILMYDHVTLHEPGLTLPHPRMHERAFVLKPLAEIAPELVLPGHGPVRELARHVDSAGVTALEDRRA